MCNKDHVNQYPPFAVVERNVKNTNTKSSCLSAHMSIKKTTVGRI